jgi:hypothetical protein
MTTWKSWRKHAGAQVIFALPPRGDTDYSMRIFNSDGSEPEMCGNGIRCLARFVAERDSAVANGKPLQQRIHTLAGVAPSCASSQRSALPPLVSAQCCLQLQHKPCHCPSPGPDIWSDPDPAAAMYDMQQLSTHSLSRGQCTASLRPPACHNQSLHRRIVTGAAFKTPRICVFCLAWHADGSMQWIYWECHQPYVATHWLSEARRILCRQG